MSNLNQKSQFNADAAYLLIRNHLYAPSIHCSYYACFQLMKVVLLSDGMTDQDIERGVQYSKSGIHKYIGEKTLEVVKNKDKDKLKHRWFANTLKELYQARLNADYRDFEIRMDAAVKASERSQSLIGYLRDNFSI